MAFSETTTRILVAAAGIPLAVGVIYAGGWLLAVVVTLLAVLCTLEFYKLTETKSVRPLTALGAAFAGLLVLLAALEPTAGPDAAGFGTAIVVALLALATASIWTRGVAGQPLLALSTTFTGAVYCGAAMSFALFLRYLPDHAGPWHGAALLLAPIVITWASDTSAYFVGRAFGTRKLIPSVSPGKTVQGAMGALVGALAVAVGYSFVLAEFPTYRVSITEAAILGLLVSVTAQVGDLVESLLKRDAGVKDSGRLLPGHGGALDRFDSMLFTLPLGYFYFRFVVGAVQPF